MVEQQRWWIRNCPPHGDVVKGPFTSMEGVEVVPVQRGAEDTEAVRELIRAYEALVVMPDPPTYQVWTLAEKSLNLATRLARLDTTKGERE